MRDFESNVLHAGYERQNFGVEESYVPHPYHEGQREGEIEQNVFQRHYERQYIVRV